MKIIISKEELEQFIPVMASSHDRVYEAVLPVLNDISERVCMAILGPVGEAALDNDPNGRLMLAFKRYIAHMAVLDVFRQLDIVLTPTGFGVVSNDNVSPASKQRVDALEASLQTSRCRTEWVLIDRLRHVENWGRQEQAGVISCIYDGTTFFSRPDLNRTAKQWEEFQIGELWNVDEFIRQQIGSPLVDDILIAYRTDAEHYQAYYEVAVIIRRIFELWFSGGRDAVDVTLRRLIEVIEADRDTFALYFSSSAFELHHHETFQNTKDSAAFVFNG
ncbi:MAG: hypothetical protein IJ355_06105 [Prevotella sp.]|nr:hypothetical protein [Prevotella sp.]